MRLKADLSLFLVAVVWGTAFVAQGVAASYRLAFLYNGASFLLAALILLPFIPRGSRISGEQRYWMLAAGGVLFAATALQQAGILYTQIANAGFLTSLYSIFTPFLLFLLFHERPHRLDVLAVAAAVTGAFLLSTAGRLSVHPGDVLEVVGAIFWGLHFVLLGKFASRFEPISFAAGHFLVTGLLNFGIGLLNEKLGTLLLLPVAAAVGYRATLSIALGYTIQVWAQRHTPPTDAAVILALEAVFAAVAGWVGLSQFLQPIQVAGCILILLAVLMSQAKSCGRIEGGPRVAGG